MKDWIAREVSRSPHASKVCSEQIRKHLQHLMNLGWASIATSSEEASRGMNSLTVLHRHNPKLAFWPSLTAREAAQGVLPITQGFFVLPA